MHSYSWKEKKVRLWHLIKNISTTYGGDDNEWLIEYGKEVFEKYKDDLDVAIECLEQLEKQLKYPRLRST